MNKPTPFSASVSSILDQLKSFLSVKDFRDHSTSFHFFLHWLVRFFLLYIGISLLYLARSWFKKQQWDSSVIPRRETISPSGLSVLVTSEIKNWLRLFHLFLKAPAYLSDLVIPASTATLLRSANQSLLFIPCSHLKSRGGLVFSIVCHSWLDIPPQQCFSNPYFSFLVIMKLWFSAFSLYLFSVQCCCVVMISS